MSLTTRILDHTTRFFFPFDKAFCGPNKLRPARQLGLRQGIYLPSSRFGKKKDDYLLGTDAEA